MTRMLVPSILRGMIPRGVSARLGGAHKLEIRQIQLQEPELHNRLLPELIGHVFHATSGRNWQRILESGSISANQAGQLGFTFPQSEQSFGRRRGYVCLFDLRGKSDEQRQSTLDKFYFLNSHKFENHSVFLILAETALAKLILPPKSHAEVNYEEIWIPESEVFFPSDLPLNLISVVLDVSVAPAPPDPAVLRAYQEMAKLA